MRTIYEAIRSRLTRVTSSGNFIPEIDGLRFIAIAAVLTYHINGQYFKDKGYLFSTPSGGILQELVETLHFGVQLFFVISGFVLSLPFVRHYCHGGVKPKLRSYYVRRVTRIEPPFVINLLLVFMLLVMVKGIAVTSLLPHLAASGLYSHNLIYHRMSDVNFVTWSLEIEAQFYLVAPFLALLLAIGSPRLRWGLLAALCAISAWFADAATPSTPWLYLTLVGQLPFFLAGFLVAGCYCNDSRSAKPSQMRWDVAAAGAWAGIAVLVLRPSHASAVALPFAVALAYVLMLRGRISRMILSLPFVTVVGGMCYSIYLYHPFLKSALKHWTFEWQVSSRYLVNSAFQVIVLGGMIVAISALFFAMFERPFMFPNWPTRLRTWLSSRGIRGRAVVLETRDVRGVEA